MHEAVASRLLDKDDLLAAYEQGAAVAAGKRDGVMFKKLTVEEILYYIGGAVVFLGIDIMLWQNWSELSVFTKLLATLGSGIAAYSVGILLSRYERLEAAAGSAFYLIFARVTPVGLAVMLDEAGMPMSDASTISIIATTMLAICLASFYILKKNIFVLFSIMFGTALFFSWTQALLGDYVADIESEFYAWRMMVAGILYIVLGRQFIRTVRAPLTGFLNGFGIVFLLGGIMAMGGTETFIDDVWNWLALAASLAVIFLSTRFSSKAFLTFGTIFFVAGIFRITADYFANSFGWPLALTLAGIMMMAAGYAYFNLRQNHKKQ